MTVGSLAVRLLPALAMLGWAVAFAADARPIVHAGFALVVGVALALEEIESIMMKRARR